MLDTAQPAHKYVESRPTTQSVWFNGCFINLTELGADHGIDPSYLSRILSGKRQPSIPQARKIAAALELTVDAFLVAVEIRVMQLEEKTI